MHSSEEKKEYTFPASIEIHRVSNIRKHTWLSALINNKQVWPPL